MNAASETVRCHQTYQIQIIGVSVGQVREKGSKRISEEIVDPKLPNLVKNLTEHPRSLRNSKWDKLKLDLQHQLFPGSSACWPTLKILNSPASINYVIQFLKINKSLSVCTHIQHTLLILLL